MHRNEFQAAILGGGPAGIFAALTLARRRDIRVHLFDINPKPGRKFAQTGSGRCNITHIDIHPEAYHAGADLTSFLNQHDTAFVRGVLADYGIPTTATEDGWVYPKSFSGANVTNILYNRLTASSVVFHGSTKVQKFLPRNPGFELDYYPKTNPAILFDALILATGSKAFPQLSADDSIFSCLRDLGIQFIPFRSALAGVTVSSQDLSELAGVRLDAEVTLLAKNETIKKHYGNLIFTTKGLNGPAVMNLSHLITEPQKGGYRLDINFLKDEDERFLSAFFKANRHRGLPLRDVFLSCLPQKLVDTILNNQKVDPAISLTSVDFSKFRKILSVFKAFSLPISGVEGFKSGQCCSGGVRFDQFSLPQMESNRYPGLFFAGEMIDVNGPCGGYNLHWAISSGLAAAEGCLRRLSAL